MSTSNCFPASRFLRGAVLGIAFLFAATAVAAEQWLQVETDQFRIIYQAGEEYTAQRVVDMADRVMRDSAAFLGYTPREKVPVVIYGATSQANGFFTPFPPHIALFVASPQWEDFAGGADWIELVFLHELVHYIHFMRPVGVFGQISRVLGPSAVLPNLLLVPGWMIEGPTVYAETALTPGGRGENPFFEATNAALILEDRMYSYRQAGYGSPLDWGRFYNSGYLMVDYLQRTYGDDAFARLNRTFMRMPFFSADRAIRLTTGVRAKDFYAAMVADLEERWAYRRDIPAGALAVPREDGSTWTVPAETDRGLIAMAAGAYRTTGFYLLPHGSDDPEGWQLLAPAAPADPGSWTVDRSGTRAVIALDSPELTGRGAVSGGVGADWYDLWELDLSGMTGSGPVRSAPARQITRQTRLFHPALSPDGSMLVAIERQGSYSRLVAVNQDDGTTEVLLEDERTTFLQPRFSPDGRFLTVSASRDLTQRLLVAEILPGAATGAATGAAPAVGVLSFGPVLPAGAEVYAPRLVDGPRGLELWYSGSRIHRRESMLLGLYRSELTPVDGGLLAGAPQLIVEDRFGVTGGYPRTAIGGASQQILYGSFAALAQTVRTAPYRDIQPREFVEVTGPLAVQGGMGASITPAVPVSVPGLPESRVYRDIPRPVIWLPLASFSSGGSGDTQVDFGALVIAPGLLGHNQIQGQFLYNPAVHQPSAAVTYTRGARATSWSVGLSQTYERLKASGGVPERTQGTSAVALDLFRPLWAEFRPSSVVGLVGGAGVRYENERTGDGDLSLGGLYGNTSVDTRDFLTMTAMLSLLREQYGSPRNHLGTPGSSLQTMVEAVPPLLRVCRT